MNIISVRVLLGNQLHDHGPNCCGLFALLVELKEQWPSETGQVQYWAVTVKHGAGTVLGSYSKAWGRNSTGQLQ